MNNVNITYSILPIQYHYIFNESAKPITEYLKTIPRDMVIRIALNISNFTKIAKWEEQLDWLPLNPFIKSVCRLQMRTHEIERPNAPYVLFTPHTGLKLLKYIFSIPACEHHPIVSEWQLNLVKAVTLANSEIINEAPRINDSSFNHFCKSVKHYQYELDDRIILYAAVYRAMCISDFFEKEHTKIWQDLCAELMNQLNSNSIRDYLKQHLSLLHNLDVKPKKKNQIFRFNQNYKYIQQTAISYTETISLDKNNDYTAFKQYPFVQLGEGEFAVIRDSFAANLIYVRLKFGLLKCYKNYHSGNIQTFFGTYDTDFIEKKLFFRVLKYSFISPHLEHYICLTEDDCKERIANFKKLHPGKLDKNNLNNLMDGYIRHKKKILVIECKGKIISSAALNDKELLKTQISESIIGPQGTGQLEKVCQRIIDKDCAWDNDIPDCYSIYPMLLVDDIGFSANGFNQYVKESTLEFVNEHKSVRPFTVLDMDTFILISELIRRKQLNIFKEIENYHKHISRPNIDEQKISFAIYLRFRYETRLPKEVHNWLRKLFS